MIKRLFDIVLATAILLVASPVLLCCMFLVWWQDGHSPFYVPKRVGRGGHEFSMVKLRSMVANADRSGVDSTGANDTRITRVGHFIRRYKLDEVSQLWNVLAGDMSLVGPRPNLRRATEAYTSVERRLLSVKPGLTDFASIVFADEGDILANEADPDIAYEQLIRPWKSRLSLFYIDNSSIILDLELMFLTALTIAFRNASLERVSRLIARLHGPDDLVEIALRRRKLVPLPPPGATAIVTARP